MRWRVLCTRPDGGVSIICPSPRCVQVLRDGGGLCALDRAREIEKLVRDPMWRPDRPDREDLAAEWIDGLIQGGYAEREAVTLIAEFSKPAFATALELVDVDEIPTDRRHRDAWRRSSNGGPIWIDDDRAREIDEARMWESYNGKAA